MLFLFCFCFFVCCFVDRAFVKKKVFRAVFYLQSNLHKSYGVLDGNVRQILTLTQTWVSTGVVLRHEISSSLLSDVGRENSHNRVGR